MVRVKHHSQKFLIIEGEVTIGLPICVSQEGVEPIEKVHVPSTMYVLRTPNPHSVNIQEFCKFRPLVLEKAQNGLFSLKDFCASDPLLIYISSCP